MSFYRSQNIKATRKQHRCEGCQHLIEAGCPALYVAGMNSAYDGVWYGHYHPECRTAEAALNDLLSWRDGDEWLALCEADAEDREWLREHHPEAFARMTQPRAVASRQEAVVSFEGGRG